MNLPKITKFVAIGVVAGIAAYASYSHMRELALTHGQTDAVASLMPVSVDGMLIVATLVMREDRQAGLSVRWWARASFLLGVGASVLANILAAAPDLTSRVISAWPAVALLLVVEMLATGKKKPAESQPEIAPVQTPAQTLPVPAETPAEAQTKPAKPKPVRAPQKAAAAKPTVRRPASETKALVKQALATDPTPTKAEVAAQVGVTTRRVYEVLSDEKEQEVSHV